jgi:hypothetical protein
MKSLGSILVCLWLTAILVQAQAAPSQATPDVGAAAPSPPPQSASAYASIRLLLQQGKYDEAVAQLQELAIKSPNLKGLGHEFWCCLLPQR